jgi:DNA-binding NarL/FixJ family response regulator
MVRRSLLIVDDHQLILDGIARLLADDELIWVKKTCTSGH